MAINQKFVQWMKITGGLINSRGLADFTQARLVVSMPNTVGILD